MASARITNAKNASESRAVPDSPRSLYLHIPFCRDRCTYCDFYSTRLMEPQVEPYLDALRIELQRRAAGRSFCNVFIGGGTPTSIPAASLARFLADLRRLVKIPAGAEFTVEANPGTLDAEKARVLRDGGVTRVSMGAQTFDPEILKAMRRIHKPADVARSVGVLRDAGFDNLNLDLIFGYPGQTLDMIQYDINQLAALGVEHVSAYALTVAPETWLGREVAAARIATSDDDLYADMYAGIQKGLAAMGMRQYEISNFARPGRICAHNLHCWDYGEYTGAGVSAWSFENGRRFGNLRDKVEYQRRMHAGEAAHDMEEILDAEARLGEMAMLKLRTLAGIDADWWRERAGRPLRKLARRLQIHIDTGLVQWDKQVLRLAPAGLFVSNAILRDTFATPQGEYMDVR